MSTLKSEPPRPVASIEELFAIAHAMEQEAAARYSEIALRLRAEGNPALAGVFDRLAADERAHLDNVVRWSQKEGGKAPDPALVRWTLPETFDDEGVGTTDPRLLSAYRSLSMALRNEERAFAFWSYVVAHAEHPGVRRAAEAMAGEELEHVATLRRERRTAYHAERAAAAAQPAADDVAALERRLAGRLDELADRSGPAEAGRMRRFASEAREAAEELRREPLSSPRRSVLGGAIPDDAVALSELLVDRYLEAAERLSEERSVLRSQAFAGRAINRLSWLRGDLPEIARPG